MTAYDRIVDAAMMRPMDAVLADEPGVTFALAFDLNVYAPAHNTAFTQDWTGDAERDLIGNRTKRFFLDSPALTRAARMDLGVELPARQLSRSRDRAARRAPPRDAGSLRVPCCFKPTRETRARCSRSCRCRCSSRANGSASSRSGGIPNSFATERATHPSASGPPFAQNRRSRTRTRLRRPGPLAAPAPSRSRRVEELRALDADLRDDPVKPLRHVPVVLPIRIMSAGTSRQRTTVASRITATASPIPNCLTVGSPLSTKLRTRTP